MKLDNSTCFLRKAFVRERELPEGFPFSLPAIHSLTEKHLHFHPNVTFIIGENGTGKSTILEGIAVAFGYNAEGGSKNINFATKETHSNLHEFLSFERGYNFSETGYFLRAETFYNVISNIEDLDKDGGLGRPVISSYGGSSLHQKSHGEGFLSLLLHRFGGNGLYILDEPEAALSPTRQLTVLARMHELVQAGCQFIIATHSPIIMAYPEAKIYELSRDGYQEVEYKETEHFEVTKNFLEAPERYLKHLLV